MSGSYKDCCNMKVICLIEISSCLVKHTEVTQKYISELTELKKSKDYMQPDKTYFCISHFLLRLFCLPDSLNILRKCRDHFVWNLRHTRTHIYRNFYRYINWKDTIQKCNFEIFCCQLIRVQDEMLIKQPFSCLEFPYTKCVFQKPVLLNH